ncbi:hypothetical protein EIP86_001040 [Pleurotus ostreatoroseus]|nr:hypothetical protein EIP86_001040 [Pleurotus ostreatoroseus]
MTAGPVDLTVKFFSPVEPTDLVKQSLPFSYFVLSAAPNDGKSHSVQVYSDISAEWVTGDNSLTANWTTTTGSIVTHQVQLATQQPFTEISDHIQQGSAFYSTQSVSGLTWQTGQDIVVRAQFINSGSLSNTQDTRFRAVSDDWPVFAFAHDLGTISQASSPIVVSVGHVRDPAIEYIIANGAIQQRSLYFWSEFSSTAAAISSFLGDYSAALTRANAFDAKVQADASKISTDYAAIVALSIRQAFGATEITISKNSNGGFNTDDILMFMKEISSDGNVNTVDVIFPSWPVFLYTNPTLGKYLLLPLFEYQATGQYPNKWSVHDMGASYPRALGHNDGNDEPMPLEESGNMLIMTLSYVQKTNDKSLLTTYFDLLDQWTQFLIAESLIPANQISTDDFAGSLANQTNLAIKGIVGIKAMSQIASLVGQTTKSDNYSSIAASYVPQWQKFATSTTGNHLTLSWHSHWGLSYNMFADKLLQTNVFPQSIYDAQTAWYSTVANSFGVPLDTRHTYTKSDWEIWTAGLVSSTTVRDLFVSSVFKYASDGMSSQPLGDWYETTDGSVEGFRARPVVGGHLALLVLPGATATTESVDTPLSSPSPRKQRKHMQSSALSSLFQAGALLAGSSRTEGASDLRRVLTSRLSLYYEALGSEYESAPDETLEAIQLRTAQEALSVVENAQSLLAGHGSAQGSSGSEPSPQTQQEMIGSRDLAQVRTLLSIVFNWAVQPLLAHVIAAIPTVSPGARRRTEVNIIDLTTVPDDYKTLSGLIFRLIGIVLPQGLKGPPNLTLITNVFLDRHLTDLLKPCMVLGWLPKSAASESVAPIDELRPLVVHIINMIPVSQGITALSALLADASALPYVRKACSYLLSRQLLRREGVRGMLAALFSEEDATGDDAPLEKLENVAKLLKSLPVGMMDTNYYANIISQLLLILSSDVETTPIAHRRAAAFSISRLLATEDNPNHTVISRILLPALHNPFLQVSNTSGTSGESKVTQMTALQTVRSLETLLTNTDPSPILISNVLTPIIPPLYSLLSKLEKVKISDPALKLTLRGLLGTWGRLVGVLEGVAAIWLVVNGEGGEWKVDVAGEIVRVEESDEITGLTLFTPEDLKRAEESGELDIDANILNLRPDPSQFIAFLKSLDRANLSSEIFVRLLEAYRETKTVKDSNPTK